jgi:hypothetical protein
MNMWGAPRGWCQVHGVEQLLAGLQASGGRGAGSAVHALER